MAQHTIDFDTYKGGDLKGLYIVTRKIDGVCVFVDPIAGTTMSKRGKPLYNFENIMINVPEPSIFECFRDNWETSVSLCRTKNSTEKVRWEDMYRLFPGFDSRLHICHCADPTEAQIKMWLMQALARKDEGIVLRPRAGTKGKPIKVKPKITIDVRVTGIQAGTGKHAGRMGALITNYGKVGTGFTDLERTQLHTLDTVGRIIEVECMEFTKDKKMRHPRFKRVRFDKDTENLEGMITL